MTSAADAAMAPSAVLEVVTADYAAHDAPAADTSLTGRLRDARVDLLTHDVSEQRDYLPASDRMLPRGARIHIAAPMKSGKTLALLAHAVDMCAAGARVAVLDRENGADEYARRLRAILTDRPAAATAAVREGLSYYAWPALTLTDGPELAHALATRDLVVIDSTRTFLSALALDEDRSDDFAKYATSLVDPLFRHGITVVQLDNAGHTDTGRARGSSSKGDLSDVIYSLKVTAAFDEHRRGSLLLKRERSRFGDITAAFTMTLGDGHFGQFTPEDAPATTDSGTFRPTVLMERISRAIEDHPGIGTRALRDLVKGQNEAKTLALQTLIDEAYIAIDDTGKGRAVHHHSTRPYREADDPSARVPEPCPNRVPAQSENTVPVCPSPVGEDTAGHHATGTHHVPPTNALLADLFTEGDNT